jgi:S1-C subfamily serine protease
VNFGFGFGVPGDGLVVGPLVDGSVAASAGFLAGDAIVGVGGTAVATEADVVAALNEHRAGETVTFAVNRDGETRDIPVTLPEEFAPLPETAAVEPMPISVADMGWDVRETESGVELVALEAGALADLAGLQAGDVITSIGGASIDSTAALRYELAHLEPGATVELAVIRHGEPRVEQWTVPGEFRIGEGAEVASAPEAASDLDVLREEIRLLRSDIESLKQSRR